VRSLVEGAGLGDLLVAVEAGQRLSAEDGLRLFTAPSLAAVGALANRVRERLHGDRCFFNRNLHVNATNVCEASCIFCSFARLKTGDAQAWTLSIEQVVARVRALSDVLVTEVHIVNGLNPDLPFDYYTDLMRALKAERPDLHLKGFTAVEIHYYAEKYGMSYEQVLQAFADAGLESMPGGGAEIFADRARRKLCHDKVDAQGWLEVHRVAHRMGMPTNCTMLFGSIETLEERVDHLLRLRALQDESLVAGGAAFQTLIPLRFHNENNRLERLRAPTGQDCLRTIAVSRLLLDNVPHIKAYWPMLGVRIAQLATVYGSDDLDGTVREEHIYHMAGASTPQGLHRHELVRLVTHAGRLPVERDTVYRVVRRDDAPQRLAGEVRAGQVRAGQVGAGEIGAEPGLPLPLPRIGAVGYTNTWPLVQFLGETGPMHLRTGHPSEVARWLDAGEVDLALLPVGALLQDRSLRIVPDLCIGCDGPVSSVLLVAEQPPETWRRVILDGVSRTSVLLARLLLTRGPLAARVRADLEIVDGAPGTGVDGVRGDVAAVVIGDVARHLPDRLGQRLDLGQLWKDWTGLPFVFAVWAGRADLHPQVVDRIRAAGLRGLERLDEAPAADRDYLRHSIRFALDDAAMMGLRRFAALAHQAGLTAHADVGLYPPSSDLAAPPPTVVADLARLQAGEELDASALARLLTQAPTSELLAAASPRRGAGPVPYALGCRIPVSASWATTADAVADLRRAGGTEVHLVDHRGAADLATWLERLRALRRLEGGVLVLPEADQTLAELGAREGRTPAELLGLLAAAGLQVAEVDLCAPGAVSLCSDLPVGLRLRGRMVHGRDQTPADQAAALLELAALARRTGRVERLEISSLHADRVAVPEADNTAVGWLRRVALARLVLPPEVAVVANPHTEGLGAMQAGLDAGAGDLGTLLQGELRVEGTESFEEALVEVERAVEDMGALPVRRGAQGLDHRPALAAAGRHRRRGPELGAAPGAR